MPVGLPNDSRRLGKCRCSTRARDFAQSGSSLPEAGISGFSGHCCLAELVRLSGFDAQGASRKTGGPSAFQVKQLRRSSDAKQLNRCVPLVVMTETSQYSS